VWLAVAMVPPVAALVALVPVLADARFARCAVVEEDGEFADLGPFDRRLGLELIEAADADVVLDLIARVLALEVRDLFKNDELLFLVDALHLHENDIRRLVDRARQSIQLLDVTQSGHDESEEAENEENVEKARTHGIALQGSRFALAAPSQGRARERESERY